jgi:tetratricopeptide (TPR) repeat protein
MTPAKRPSDPSRRRGGGRPTNRSGPGRPDERDPNAGPRQWGSLARKGARRLGEDVRGAGTAEPDRRAPDRGAPDEWVDEGPVRAAARGAVRRGKATRPGPSSSVDTADAGVARAVGEKDAAKFEQRLRDAAKAYERERYGEARTALVPLAERMPANAAVRELLGLTYYRLGRWKQAIGELEVFRDLTSSTEQHPVLADCYRALKRWDQVDALWEELREVSPSAELVTEGRIVTAGSLADRDRLPDALTLLEKGFRFPKHPQSHHLRRAYALADLRERVGDLPQARSLFERIEALDPEFGDVGERVRSLR